MRKGGLESRGPMAESELADDELTVDYAYLYTRNVDNGPFQDPPERQLWGAVIALAVRDYQSKSLPWCGLTEFQRPFRLRAADFDVAVAHPGLKNRLRMDRWTFEHPPIFQ